MILHHKNYEAAHHLKKIDSQNGKNSRQRELPFGKIMQC